MVYGMPPAPPAPRKPPISGVDLGVSITAIILTVAFGAFATFIGVFMLAFLDTCPPATCSLQGAIGSVSGTLLITGVTGVIGITFTVLALLRRALAWPIAVGTFVACVVICVVGINVFGIAIGAEDGWLLG
jgi:vacuolar-type H+-ATPase subunit I/STV1